MWMHVAATLFHLLEYKQLNLKSVPADKTSTDVLQKWNIPGVGANNSGIRFSEITFFKPESKRDTENTRKRPLVTVSRDFCVTPVFAHKTLPENLKH